MSGELVLLYTYTVCVCVCVCVCARAGVNDIVIYFSMAKSRRMNAKSRHKLNVVKVTESNAVCGYIYWPWGMTCTVNIRRPKGLMVVYHIGSDVDDDVAVPLHITSRLSLIWMVLELIKFTYVYSS